MNVMLVIRALDIGGAQRQLVTLANGLECRGHRVTVVTSYPGGELDSALDGPRLLTLGQTSRREFLRMPSRLRKLIADGEADVVHGYLPTANILAALARGDGAPALVWGVRASDMQLEHYDLGHRLAFAWSCRLARRADLIISNSEAAVAFHASAGYPPERMRVIPNGIDVDRFRPDPQARVAMRREWGIADDQFVLGVVARLDPMKDHDMLLTAFARGFGADASAVLCCIGDGEADRRAGLERRAEALGLRDRVRWVPSHNDPWKIYPAFDVHVSGSRFGEGFSNALGEAMACGVPCIATQVGDAAKVLGDTGLLVPAGDAVAMADAMRHAVELARRESQRTRQRVVAEFGVERLLERTESALHEAIARRRSLR